MAMVLALSCVAHGEGVLKQWEYYRGDLGGTWEGLRTGKEFKTNPAWEEVTVPHCFNATDAVDPYVAYYQGPGWYRTVLEMNNPYPDGRTLLRFGGAGQKTKVFVGSTLVGEHVGGYDEFSFDITDAVNNHLNDGRVTLLVRCDNSRDLEMMPSDLSDFNLYGGLYRPVHLEYRPFVSAEWPAVDTAVDEAGKEGTIFFRV
jgi:beta-galactosidase